MCGKPFVLRSYNILRLILCRHVFSTKAHAVRGATDGYKNLLTVEARTESAECDFGPTKASPQARIGFGHILYSTLWISDARVAVYNLIYQTNWVQHAAPNYIYPLRAIRIYYELTIITSKCVSCAFARKWCLGREQIYHVLLARWSKFTHTHTQQVQPTTRTFTIEMDQGDRILSNRAHMYSYVYPNASTSCENDVYTTRLCIEDVHQIMFIWCGCWFG